MANFNRAPYYDDFDENKKFLQILFQPGRPVQARELTQLQSILQNQIERGGAHIFKHGAKVFSAEIEGGQQNYNNQTISFLRVNAKDRNGAIVDVSNFVGQKIKPLNLQDGDSIGTVVAATSNSAGDPATLFIDWQGNPPTNLQADIVLRSWDSSGTTSSYYTVNTHTTMSPIKGPASIYQTATGVYFVNGRYVKADAQTLVLGKYTSNTTYRIGFDVVENTVSSSEDSSLLDPASGFSNYTGAGSDRYKIDLVLTKKGDGNTITQLQASNTISTEIGEIVSTNNFFEIARVEKGVLTRSVKTPMYAELENMLARKIYDQSGNFTVEDHRFRLKEKNPKGNFGLEGSGRLSFAVDDGKSYVAGFEYNNKGRTAWVDIEKARTSVVVPDQKVPMFFSNYVTLHDVQNNISQGFLSSPPHAYGFFDVNNQDRVSLFSQDRYITDSQYGANNITLTGTAGTLLSANIYNSILVGTARVEAFRYDSSATTAATNKAFQGRSYRLYLTDFDPNYVTGTSNGINSADITSVYWDSSTGYSYYKLAAAAQHVHGFSNVGVDDTATQFSSGSDYVSIQGFTFDDGYWNMDRAVVKNANGTHIGVQSTRNATVNNYYGGTTLTGMNPKLVRTTRSGISPRRLIVLDGDSRALWSDASVSYTHLPLPTTPYV